MPDVINVQVTFERTHETYGIFRDALYIPFDDYGAMSEGEITALQDARYNAWVTAIEEASEAPPPTTGRVYSKFGFRRLMTQEEQIACDNYDSNDSLTPEAKAVMRTITINFQVADEIDLDDPATIAGVQALEDFGLIGEGRAAEILASAPWIVPE